MSDVNFIPAAPRPLSPSHGNDHGHANHHPADHGNHHSPTAPKITSPAPLGSKPKDDLSSLALTDTPRSEKDKPKIQITAYGVSGTAEKTFKRCANMTGTHAVHVKMFHSIISDEGVQRLEDKINEWVEAHPLIEVKNVTSDVGLWHGKTQEPSLIITIWY